MNITLDIYQPVELRAFAAFMIAVAEAQESRISEKMDAYGLAGLGGVNQEPSKVWRTATEAGVDEGYLTERTGAEPHPEGVGSLVDKTVAGGPVDGVPVRKRGEPSPGHKRRTKAEIAEDEAAAAAETTITQGSGDVFKDLNVDKPAAISTGGERVAPDDDSETEQADAADEAAETAKAGAELSHDDVRGAMGKYVEKFGMDAAQIDLPKLFALALKDPAITKVSLIPGDQKSLKIVVDGVNEMLAKNPFSRDAVA